MDFKQQTIDQLFRDYYRDKVMTTTEAGRQAISAAEAEAMMRQIEATASPAPTLGACYQELVDNPYITPAMFEKLLADKTMLPGTGIACPDGSTQSRYISAADLAEALMRQIEVDGAIHKNNLIAVAKMHGCK